MSYIDTEEFQEKAEVFRKRAQARRAKMARQVFDADTADTASVLAAAEFREKLAGNQAFT